MIDKLHPSETVQKIAELPAQWHGAGTVKPEVLSGIAKHADAMKPIEYSVETGTGKTTLLFSHISKHHTVFTIDFGESLSKVRNCPILRSDVVEFVEGPSQLTLPRHVFDAKAQIVLIDGPHGYPFPDLEYYYLYPILDEGGLLLVDDIHIPSINNMFRVLKADDMFDLVEVIGETAFFRRTSAPMLNPLGDDWWLQKYNTPQRLPAGLRRAIVEKCPRFIKNALPKSLKRQLWKGIGWSGV
jgi:hypothetical protein